MTLRILVIDDNPDDRALVLRQIQAEFPDARTVELASLAALEEELAGHAPDLVVTDLDLRWTSGLDVLDRVKMRAPFCPVIMFTGSGDEETAVEAMKRGLDDYIVKSPRQLSRLRASIRQAVQASQQRAELHGSRKLLADRERELEAALAHKDIILRELHHRVKNNLQTINALLRMRAKRSDDPRLAADLTEIAQRMTALAQVQARILEDDSLDRVDFSGVIEDMSDSLAAIYANSHITVVRKIEGAMVLPVARAMPLGTICYEVLVNTFKHAFPDHRRGTVEIGVRGDGRAGEVTVADDGVGFDESQVREGFGSRIVRGLAAEAGIDISRRSGPGQGTVVTLRLLDA